MIIKILLSTGPAEAGFVYLFGATETFSAPGEFPLGWLGTKPSATLSFWGCFLTSKKNKRHRHGVGETNRLTKETSWIIPRSWRGSHLENNQISLSSVFFFNGSYGRKWMGTKVIFLVINHLSSSQTMSILYTCSLGPATCDTVRRMVPRPSRGYPGPLPFGL